MSFQRMDRTTDGTGYVCDFMLDELRNLKIDAGQSTYTRILSIEGIWLRANFSK